MFDVSGIVSDLSIHVKVGWALWLAWGVVMVGWYRHGRLSAPVAHMATPARPTHTDAETPTDLTDPVLTRQPSNTGKTTGGPAAVGGAFDDSMHRYGDTNQAPQATDHPAGSSVAALPH